MATSVLDSKVLYFKVFCFEAYKSSHNMTGREAMNLFTKYKVFEYLESFYDVLHTLGREYLIEDIDIYINARKKDN